MKIKVKVPPGSAAQSAAPAVIATAKMFADTQQLLSRPAKRWGPFSGSVVFHIILIPLIQIAVFRTAAFNPNVDYPKPPRPSTIKDRVIWLPRGLARNPPGQKASATSGGTPAPGRGAARAGQPAPPPRQAAAKTQQASAAPAPARFEMPKQLEKPGVTQTIIQPLLSQDTPPDLHTQLPNIALTTVETPQVNKPIPERFALPSRSQPVQPQKKEAVSAAGLELPTVRPGQMEQNTHPSELSKLLPNAPTLNKPLERYQPPSVERQTEQTARALDPPPGESIQVLALSNQPAPLGPLLVIPEVNQVAPAAAGSGQGGGDGQGSGLRSSGDGSQSGAASAASGSGSNVGSRGNGLGGTASSGDGRGSSTDAGGGLSIAGGEPGPGSGNARDGSNTGSGGGTLTAGAGGPGVVALGDGFSVFGGESGPGTIGGEGGGIGVQGGIGDGPPIRMAHPENGRFDVVVVQSGSSGGAIPGSEGHIKGRPIYTVYLSVGTTKDWILQYALVGSEAPDPTQGQIVSLSSPPPLQAPYPIETVVPPTLKGARRGFLMIHGTLDKDGRWKGLEVVSGSVKDFETACLPMLMEWRFRPATRDGVPVAVEVLLAIPPARA